MQLELALVQSCAPTGCRVQRRDGSVIDAIYSPLVRDRIDIHPQQLVALDMAADPPQIVWRWVRARAHELTPSTVIVDDGRATLVELVRVAALDVAVAEGDDLWTCRTGGPPELHDRAVGGWPADPTRLLAYIRPVIEAIYSA